MLLAIDIGNTNITLGIFQNGTLKTRWRIATSIHRLSDEYATLLLALLETESISRSSVTEAVLCSVVPPLTTTFTEMCSRYFTVEPLVVEAGVKTGVSIVMDNPHEVGTDRVVNAAGANHLYGGPVIIIDFGTATTLDVVSDKGEYLGGVIAPGVTLGAEALFTRTAALPRVEIVRPKRVIGKNTVGAMQSGIIFGYVGLVDGLVGRIQEELGKKAKVIATGGLASIISKETSIIQTVEPDLTLIGLRIIYEMNRRA
ncbi:type III pantothenate kinase [Chloroflexota bacterium]